MRALQKVRSLRNDSMVKSIVTNHRLGRGHPCPLGHAILPINVSCRTGPKWTQSGQDLQARNAPWVPWSCDGELQLNQVAVPSSPRLECPQTMTDQTETPAVAPWLLGQARSRAQANDHGPAPEVMRCDSSLCGLGESSHRLGAGLKRPSLSWNPGELSAFRPVRDWFRRSRSRRSSGCHRQRCHATRRHRVLRRIHDKPCRTP